MKICFAHVSYQFALSLVEQKHEFKWFQVKTFEEVEKYISEIDILVISGLWKNSLLKRADKLKLVQSISAGVEQYDQQMFKKAGVKLASGKGVNASAVSEHVLGLILTLTRQLHVARDDQRKHFWKPMISDHFCRQDEVRGKTLLIVGFGDIGQRVAKLAKAFGIDVIAIRKSVLSYHKDAKAVFRLKDLHWLLPNVDIVVITCPLTPETNNLFGRSELELMKSSAILINVARGDIVNEEDLIRALKNEKILGAGIDVTHEEPLNSNSQLWSLKNLIITPHSAGETRRYENNVLDLLFKNLDRLKRGDEILINQIV